MDFVKKKKKLNLLQQMPFHHSLSSNDALGSSLCNKTRAMDACMQGQTRESVPLHSPIHIFSI
jgi:hypothetical protein